MAKNYVVPFEVTSVLGGSLTIAYQAFNPDGFLFPCTRLRIVNDTYVQMRVSFDGIYDHLFLDASDELDLNFQMNNSPASKISKFDIGTIVYIKKDNVIIKSGNVRLIAYGATN